MTDHTQDPQRPQDPQSPSTRTPFVPPSLEPLGALASVTRGPAAAGTQDAIIFAGGGDPGFVDPS